MKSDAFRVAIVTGGGRGLGRAMVLGLLQNDFAVAAVDRDAAPLEEISAIAHQDGHAATLLTITADLTLRGAAEQIGTQVLARFARLDILVNNAGMGVGLRLKALLDQHLLRFETLPAGTIWVAARVQQRSVFRLAA